MKQSMDVILGWIIHQSDNIKITYQSNLNVMLNKKAGTVIRATKFRKEK